MSFEEDLYDSTDYISYLHKFVKNFPDPADEEGCQCFVKKINRFLRKHPDINKLDTKDLNAEFNIKGHAFSKINGQQTLIKKYYTPMCRSKSKQYDTEIKELNDRIKECEEMIKSLQNSLQKQQEIIRNLSYEMTNSKNVTRSVPTNQDRNDLSVFGVKKFNYDNY